MFFFLFSLFGYFLYFALTLTIILPESVFFTIFHYSNQSPTKKGVSPMFALILPKTLPKTNVFSIFALIKFALTPTKKCVFFILHFFLTKALPKAFLLYFALILTKALQQSVFFFLFALILSKALSKSVFYSMFALILTKALPKRVFLYYCPKSTLSPI